MAGLNWTSYASDSSLNAGPNSLDQLYNNSVSFFYNGVNKPAPLASGVVTTLQLDSVTQSENPSFMTFSLGQISNVAIEFSGYFVPNQTGFWTIYLGPGSTKPCDDFGILFLGKPGDTITPGTSFTGDSNVPDNTLPFIHNRYDSQINSKSVSLKAGYPYPLLIYYNQGSDGYTLGLGFSFESGGVGGVGSGSGGVGGVGSGDGGVGGVGSGSGGVGGVGSGDGGVGGVGSGDGGVGGVGSGSGGVGGVGSGGGSSEIITDFSTITSTVPIPIPPPITCFNEGSKILTDRGYIAVEDLRKGDLVKTFTQGYKAIDMIGKKGFYNPAEQIRIKDQLYKCSVAKYPELIEDLIITGCHCILIDEFESNEQRDKTVEINNGDIYITENQYRLPACVDDRADIYETDGIFTVYHFALENDDYYTNYGVYANGLLVESCSKRYLKELSNMELIE